MVAAEVSGPAEQSKRTDLGVLKQSTQPVKAYTGGEYGNNKSMSTQQGSAPMAGNPFPSFAPMNSIGLDAPTERPDEPGTAGIDIGPGGGSELMMDRPTARPSLANTLQKLAMFDDTGEAELIYQTYNR
jgi:hypothetical protein